MIRVFSTKQAIDKLWLLPNKMLASSTLARPAFLGSFYYNNPHLKEACSGQDAEKYSSCLSVLEEQNISIVMIQSWEDFLTARSLDATGDVVWINNFIQWAQSPYLKEYFDSLKYNFKSTTIEFGNVLFRFAAKIPRYTYDPEVYRKTVQEVLKDPEYLHIVNQVVEEARSYETI